MSTFTATRSYLCESSGYLKETEPIQPFAPTFHTASTPVSAVHQPFPTRETLERLSETVLESSPWTNALLHIPNAFSISDAEKHLVQAPTTVLLAILPSQGRPLCNLHYPLTMGCFVILRACLPHHCTIYNSSLP